MTDIVERLRDASVHSVHFPGGTVYAAASCELLEQAADIIESLRSLCGKADVGPRLAEMTKKIRRGTEFVSHLQQQTNKAE